MTLTALNPSFFFWEAGGGGCVVWQKILTYFSGEVKNASLEHTRLDAYGKSQSLVKVKLTETKLPSLENTDWQSYSGTNPPLSQHTGPSDPCQKLTQEVFDKFKGAWEVG